MRRILAVPMALAVAGLLAACGSPGPGTSASPTPKDSANSGLAGTSWALTEYAASGTSGPESVVADSTVTAVFGNDKTLSGNGECNTYTGPFTLSGPALTFGALAATKKACSPSITNQESAYFDALSRVATYSIRGQVLKLRDNKGALQAGYTAAK